jgi:hypothetical protein
MARKRGKTPVYDYLESIEKHFTYLVEAKKMTSETRESFFEEFLGCSKTSYKGWWTFGIRKIYLVILFLLDELQEHRKRIKILEKQLNEITKK